jgi:hypothetical protein
MFEYHSEVVYIIKMKDIEGETTSVLMAVAFILSGYFLLWVNKSRQPMLIAIWALFMAQCIVVIVQ